MYLSSSASTNLSIDCTQIRMHRSVTHPPHYPSLIATSPELQLNSKIHIISSARNSTVRGAAVNRPPVLSIILTKALKICNKYNTLIPTYTYNTYKYYIRNKRGVSLLRSAAYVKPLPAKTPFSETQLR